MTFDFTVTLGNAIEIASIIGGLAACWVKLNNNVLLLNNNLIVLKDDIVGMQEEIKKITGIMIQLAEQTVRMNNLSERINMMDKRYDELRRGEGWVHKNFRGGGIDGEYP